MCLSWCGSWCCTLWSYIAGFLILVCDVRLLSVSGPPSICFICLWHSCPFVSAIVFFVCCRVVHYCLLCLHQWVCVAFCSFSSCVFLLGTVLCLILFRSFLVVILSFGFLSSLISCESLFFHLPRSFISTCPVLPRRLLSVSAPQRFLRLQKKLKSGLLPSLRARKARSVFLSRNAPFTQSILFIG